MSKIESVLIRVDAAVIKDLDEVAASRHMSRSAVIRNLMANCKVCYPFLESEWKAEEPTMVKLEREVSEEVINTLPEEYSTPEMALILSRIMRKVAKALEKNKTYELKK